MQFAEPQPGGDFGPYSHLTPFAQGGMAELWLARHAGHGGLEKLVVLKRVLPGHAADPEFHEMFLREARIAASLDHPNVARVYDSGVSPDGRSFLAMEYVHGVDLRALIRAHQRTPLAIGHAVTIAAALCTALDYVHARCDLQGQHLGLIHRDISPGNVLLSFDGAIKLTDFGVAGAGTASLATTSGTVKGKLAYMAPEQARGQRLDHRADLYALGVVLYEMTTGLRPFGRTKDVALLYRLLEDTPPPPSDRHSGYPQELERIVLRALHKDPQERYPSAGAMLRDLEEFAVAHGLVLSASRVGQYAADRCGKSEPPSLTRPPPAHDSTLHGLAVVPPPSQLHLAEGTAEASLDKIQSVITRHQPTAARPTPLRWIGGVLVMAAIVGGATIALWPRAEPVATAAAAGPDHEPADAPTAAPSPAAPRAEETAVAQPGPPPGSAEPEPEPPVLVEPPPAPEAADATPRRKRKRKRRKTPKNTETKSRALDNPLPFGGS